MSAILIRINIDNAPLSADSFYHAFDSIAQYGGDASNVWLEESVGLGQHLLFYTPESHFEKLPYEQNNLVIVVDGRIDNRDELCQKFAVNIEDRKIITDSQLILFAYQQWGENCTDYLLGDFAFAIWDKTNLKMFCTRDHIGTRPLYYYHLNSVFVAATDIRAFLAFHDLKCDLDERQIATFLYWPYDVVKKTFFDHIHILQPGQQLVLKDNMLSHRSHWIPQNAPDIRYRKTSEYKEHLFHLLETSIRDRLRTPYKIGSHLSGGLDSTSVTIIANRQLREQGRQLDMAYTWSPAVSETYPLQKRDERNTIESVCQSENIVCHYGTAGSHDLRSFLARDMALESPNNLFEELPVISHASQRGIRMILSGWGGDEGISYSGLGYLAFLLKQGRLLRMMQITREQVGIRHLKRTSDYLFLQAIIPLLPDIIYKYFDPMFKFEKLPVYINQEFRGRFPNALELRTMKFRISSNIRQQKIELLKLGSVAERMATWANWSSGYQLFHTYPLTDRRILEFAIGLPPEMHYQQKTWRFLFHYALKDLLPNTLSKRDVTNQRKRWDIYLGCWHILANEVKTGIWQESGNPWIDAKKFYKEITQTPSELTDKELYTFVALTSPVRVAYLWQRYMSKK